MVTSAGEGEEDEGKEEDKKAEDEKIGAARGGSSTISFCLDFHMLLIVEHLIGVFSKSSKVSCPSLRSLSALSKRTLSHEPIVSRRKAVCVKKDVPVNFVVA